MSDEVISVFIDKLTEIVDKSGQIENQHLAVERNESEDVNKDVPTTVDQVSGTKQDNYSTADTKVLNPDDENFVRTGLSNLERSGILSRDRDQLIMNLPSNMGQLNLSSTKALLQSLITLNSTLHSPESHSIVHDNVHPSTFQSTAETEDKPMLHCTKCDYQSYNKYYLKQHVDLVHKEDRPFKCPFCDYAGKRSHSLKEHLVVHSTDRPFRCMFCNASFRKKAHLTSHVRMHAHAAKKVRCEFCQLLLDDMPSLKKHILDIHNEEEWFSCDYCSYITSESSSIYYHMHSHGNPQVYKCANCAFTAVHSKIIENHVLKSHADIDLETVAYKVLPPSTQLPVIFLKCSICGFTTDKKEDLKDHMIKHVEKGDDTVLNGLPTNATTTEGVIYKCSECQYTSPDSNILIAHMLSHQPAEETEKTSNLSSVSILNTDKQEQDFNNSEIFTQVKGSYRCNICGYTCSHQRTIKAHIWRHSGQKNVDYPMFQNGPLSVYDATPIGKTTILPSASIISPKAKVHIGNNVTDVDFEHFETNSNVNKPVFAVATDVAVDNLEYYSIEVVEDETIVDKEPQAIKDKSIQDEMDTCIPEEVSKQTSEPSLKRELKQLNTCKDVNLSSENKDQRKSSCLSLCSDHQYSSANGLHNVQGEEKLESLESAQDNVLNEEIVVESSDVMQTNESVIVEKMDDSFTIPIYSCGNSTPMSSPQAVELSHLVEPSKRQPKHGLLTSKDMEESSEDIQTKLGRDRTISESSEEVVSLLSLLKKAPRHNQPVKAGSSEDESDSKPKKGICSSLLAVIEHLRERSKDDGEEPVQSGKKRRGRKRKSDADLDSLNVDFEEMPNVEILASSSKAKSPVYRCMLCHYTNSIVAVIKTHMKLHKEKQPRECSLCEFVAASSSELQDHMLKHCKIRTYHCKLCPSVFPYKSQLRAHMRAHEKGPYRCAQCGFLTNFPIAFRNHMRGHAEKCEHCDHEAADFNSLQAHMLEEHNQIIEDSDTQDDSATDDSGDHVNENDIALVPNQSTAVEEGQGIKENSSEIKSRTPLYKCCECPFTTPVMNAMKMHCMEHYSKNHPASPTHEERKEISLKCEYCDFNAISSRSLKSHMKRHSNDQRFVQQPLEQYKCNLCGYVCHHLPSLKSHMWRHTTDSNYSYTATNDIINAAIDFDTHLDPQQKQQSVPHSLKTKESSVPMKDDKCFIAFRCCQCGFESIDKSALNEHMKIHLDVIKKTLRVSKNSS